MNFRLIRVILFFAFSYSVVFSNFITANAKEKKPPNIEDHAQYFSSFDKSKGLVGAKKADDLRLKTIASIQKLVGKKLKSPRNFELYLRLGELLAERADYLRAVEINDWDQRHNSWIRSGKKGKEPKLTHSRSKKELLKSAGAFRKLIRLYPKHPRVDAALFSLGKTLSRLENRNAEIYFKRLIKNHKSSVLLSDAYLALGEYYFDKNKVSQAKAAYKKAIRFKGSKTYPYAVYKLGWTYYNSAEDTYSENMRKALAAFKLVVRLSEKQKRVSGLDLRKEALSDLVMVWAEIEGVNDAWAYFSKMDEYEAFYDVLERLGNTYIEQGKNKKAIASFTRLLKEAPHRERSPEIYKKLLQQQDLIGDSAGIIRDLKKMHSRFFLGKGTWFSKNNDKELRRSAKELVRKQVHRYSTLYHQRGQKRNQDRSLSTAMRIYQLYLGYFPRDKVSYDIRFYLADIYMHFKMYEKAANSYKKVALTTKKGKYFNDASLSMVTAINTLVNSKKWPKVPAFGKVKRPILIPREKKKLIDIIDIFVGLRPKDKASYPMMFTAAKTFFDYGHYKEGLGRFQDIALKLPKQVQGQTALKTVLTFHSSRKEWRTVISKSRMFLSLEAVRSGKIKGIVVGHLKNAMFKQASLYANNKKYGKAAKLFLAYQSDFPKDQDSDEALYNAAINYYKMAAVDEALEVDQKLITFYPKSSLIPDVNLNIARTYEAIADFPKAAKYYREFSRRFPKDKRSSAALYNAATILKGMKQYEASARYFMTYVKMYPSRPNVSSAWFECGNLFEMSKDYRSAISAFQNYLSVHKGSIDRKLYVQAKVAELQLYYVDSNSGSKSIQRLASFFRKEGKIAAFEARRIVAGAIFSSISSDVKRFIASKIRSAASLEGDVQSMQSSLLSIADKLQRVISVGSGEYVVASLFSLGEVHESFAEKLFRAPPPRGANQVTIDQYRSSIEKVAFPLKEEAFKYYETAYKRSSEIETFSIWTKKAYSKMADLAPESNPEVWEKSAEPSYLSLSLKWQPEIEDLRD